MTDSALAALLFLQLGCILAACRAIGVVARRVRQPQVIAEMVAGFLLGPSFFGWLAPAWQASLFPAETLRPLFVLSQVGLALYMFCVGLEFHIDILAQHRRRAIAVSIAGIAVPCVLGSALALLMLGRGGLFTEHVQPVHAMLFLSAAMAITAFPVLARIISERGISGPAVGSLALAARAVDDAAARIILAVVLSSVTGTATLAGGTNPVEMGTLRTGDIDDSNCVDVADFNLLVTTFGRSSGDPGYDARADLDGSNTVDVADFSLLKNNFGNCGAPALAP